MVSPHPDLIKAKQDRIEQLLRDGFQIVATPADAPRGTSALTKDDVTVLVDIGGHMTPLKPPAP